MTKKLDHVLHVPNRQNRLERATRPPLQYAHRIHHWLHSERGQPGVGEWRDGNWYCVNEVGPITPKEMFKRGWEWHAPVKLSKSRNRMEVETFAGEPI